MKKIYTILTMLTLFVSGAWADGTWNITSTDLTTDGWSNLSGSVPAGVTALGNYTPWSRTENITVSQTGIITVTFRYTTGQDQLVMLGVDLLDGDDNVVASDYHYGKSGSGQDANTYLVPATSTGSYKLRYIIHKDGNLDSSEGTITVSKIVYADSYANISQWYKIRMHSNQTHYLKTNGSALSFTDSPDATNDYLWAFVGNPTDGFQIYNYNYGSTKAIDNATPCAFNADGTSNAIKLTGGRSGSSTSTNFCISMKNGGEYYNYQGGAIKRWSGNDEGSAFILEAAEPVSLVEGSTDAAPIYYAWRTAVGNNPAYMYTEDGAPKNPNNTAPSSFIDPIDAKYAWQFVGNASSGFAIKNKATGTYLGGRTVSGGGMTMEASASCYFIPIYNSATNNKWYCKNYNYYIDRSSNAPYAHTSGNNNDYIRLYNVHFTETNDAAGLKVGTTAITDLSTDILVTTSAVLTCADASYTITAYDGYSTFAEALENDNDGVIALTITAIPGTALNSTVSGAEWSDDGTQDWNQTWTNNGTPKVSIVSGTSAGSAGVKAFLRGTTNASSFLFSAANSDIYYTISVPHNYIIKSYTIVGTANADLTIVPTEGSANNTLFSNGIQSTSYVTVHNNTKNYVSFKLTGGASGKYLNEAIVYVEYELPTSITTLPTANNKAYAILNERSMWKFADDDSEVSATNELIDTNDDTYQWAIISYNDNYYLYSVNKKGYLKADKTLTALPSNNEQVDIVATENATYPWFFRFKMKNDQDQYTKNINANTTYLTINGWGPGGTTGSLDAGNRNMIVEAVDFDATEALSMFNQKTVTYILHYNLQDIKTVENVSVSYVAAENFVPASFIAPACVTYEYDPETITASTTEVTVNATWNGPFKFSTDSKDFWYALDMHQQPGQGASLYPDYTWKYDNSNGVILATLGKSAYNELTDGHLFRFVGDPFDGFKIYNKAAGNTVTLSKASDDAQAYLTNTDNGNLFQLYASNGSVPNSYCFKRPGDSNYLNHQDQRLQPWTGNDAGSSCRFFTPGSYYENFLDGLNLDAPVGAVGTKAGVTTDEVKNNLQETKELIHGDPFVVVGNAAALGAILDPIRISETITLGAGYWRILNAYPGFVTNQGKIPAIYYDSSADKLKWGINAKTEEPVNNILKFAAGSTDGTYTIFSPNAQKSLKAATEDGDSKELGLLDATAGDVTFTSLGSSCQYTFKVEGNTRTIHANGHSNGTGPGGTLVSWNGEESSCSAWYIVKADAVDVSLNGPVGGSYYATLCLPFDVTISGATAYTLAKEGTTLNMTEVSTVPAGTPVLLVGSSDKATANIASTAATGAPVTTTALTGTYTDISFDGATNYVLGSDGSKVGFFHWQSETTDPLTLKANRAYIAGSGTTAKGFYLNFETDGINTVMNSQAVDGTIYNLQGQKVNKAQRGLYIINGKKVVVK